MMVPGRVQQRDRRETNPALGRRKLKLGTFQTNLNSGCVMSDLDGRLELTWPNTVTLAKLADEMEFEALVPVARWRGFGGATDPQGPGFETFTWAAGIAFATQNSGVISTSHVALNHPIIAAKKSTVIDHISNGRYTFNVVNGWNFRKWKCSACRSWSTRIATPAPKNGRNRQAALDQRREIRLRRQVLSRQRRLFAAKADPSAFRRL